MKRIKDFNLYLFFVAIVLLLGFTSCSSGGDDDKSVSSQLVGAWKTSMTASNWRYILLEANGICYHAGSLDGIAQKSEKANWAYNEAKQTISMYSDDGYYNYNLEVTMASDGNSWSGKGNGRTSTFVRVTSTSE